MRTEAIQAIAVTTQSLSSDIHFILCRITTVLLQEGYTILPLDF